jgi:hypothetical protein
VFFVSGFDKALTTQDILGFFSPIGNARVHWIHDTACFVSINDAPDLRKVFNLVMDIKGPFQVLPFSEYSKIGTMLFFFFLISF